jgi:hypothetical protein
MTGYKYKILFSWIMVKSSLKKVKIAFKHIKKK